MKPVGCDLESIYDSSDQTINRSLAEFLSLPALRVDITNDFSFENLGLGVASLTPEIVAYSRQQSNDVGIQLEPVGSTLMEPCDLNDYLPRPPKRVSNEVDHMFYPPSIDFIDSEISVYPPTKDNSPTNEFGGDIVDGAIFFPSIASDEIAEEPELTPAQLLPGLVKINMSLTERGHLPLILTAGDVDLSTKSVSVDAVNQWVACLSGCIQEMGERLELQQRAVQSAAMSARTGKQSYSSLLDRSEALEEKLKEARQKISLAEMQKSLLVDENSSRSRIRKSEEGDGKRIAKGYDQQLQESERRVRQRDTEIERLKTKLEAFACKERVNAARLREALSSWKSGAVLSTAKGTGSGAGVGMGSVASPNSRPLSSIVFNSPPGTSPSRRDSMSSASGTRRDSIASVRRESISSATTSVTPLRRESSMSFRRESLTAASKIRRDISRESGKQQQHTGSEETSAWDVIEALDAQKNILERRNEELSELLEECGRNSTSECRSLWGRERDRDRDRKGERDSQRDRSSHRYSESERDDIHSSTYLVSKSDIFSDIDEGGLESILENRNVGSPRCTVRPPSHTHMGSLSPPSGTQIADQQRRIEALQSSCEKLRSKREEGDKLCHQLRLRVQEAQEEIEELRAELVTRPTVKQWTSKLRELSESEGKRLDLVAIRRESLEVLAERERENKRHMSVHQQVLTDKRNDQLGLWVLDSLSFEHTKNALKAVCRELGLTDVGDIQPSLIKLKAVVGAVPRMERFITQVCGFLFRHEEERAKKWIERERERERSKGRYDGSTSQDPSFSLFAPVSVPLGSMEHVLPLLELWWNELQSIEGLLDFREKVTLIVMSKENNNNDNNNKNTSAPSSSSSSSSSSKLSHRPLLTDTDTDTEDENVLRALRELTALSLKMRHLQPVLGEADRLTDQHDTDSVLSRTVQCIKGMVGVTSLEDLLPRLNQMLVSAVESRNFLNAMRNILSLERKREGRGRDGWDGELEQRKRQGQIQHSGDRDRDEDDNRNCSMAITDNMVFNEITRRISRRTLDSSDSNIPDNITGPPKIV